MRPFELVYQTAERTYERHFGVKPEGHEIAGFVNSMTLGLLRDLRKSEQFGKFNELFDDWEKYADAALVASCSAEPEISKEILENMATSAAEAVEDDRRPHDTPSPMTEEEIDALCEEAG